MDTNERKWVENDLVYQITGCAMAIMNELGHGLREKTYERACCVEFKYQNSKLKWKKVVLTEPNP